MNADSLKQWEAYSKRLQNQYDGYNGCDSSDDRKQDENVADKICAYKAAGSDFKFSFFRDSYALILNIYKPFGLKVIEYRIKISRRVSLVKDLIRYKIRVLKK